MPSVFDAFALWPEVARSALYKLMPGPDPFVRDALGGAMPTNEEITGAAGGMPVTGVGSVGWKLTKNAPSWLQRAFEGGKREIPLQEGTPRRAPIQGSGLVKNPVTYELPESADELAPLLEQLGGSYGPRKLPPVSGGAPSMFEKFTSKGLPVPEYFPPGKGTQDILGRLRERTGYSTKHIVEDFFSDMPSPKPGKFLEDVLRKRKSRGLTDEEVAAVIRRAEQVQTNALDEVRPPPEPEQIRAWVRSVLGF